MNDSTKANKELATSMENPDLDDRPILLKIANIDPAKHTRRTRLKKEKPNEPKEIKVRDRISQNKPKKNPIIYENSRGYALKSFIKPWQWITLILLAVTIFSALEISHAIRTKADVTPVCIGTAVTVDGVADRETIKC